MTRTPEVLITAEINGKPVTFFKPPHDEPDFPWVDIEQLAQAFLDDGAAARMVRHAHDFDRLNRPMTTARNGQRIATIVPHAIAQGLCGAIDQWNGFTAKDEEDTGPVFDAYARAAGLTAVDHWPLSFEDMIHAFRNPGGPFMRTVQ